MSASRPTAPMSVLVGQCIFGAVDGLNGAVGLLVGLLAAHAATNLIVVGIIAQAIPSTVSMAGAEFESDEETETRHVRLAKVAAMAIGFLGASIAPAAGFFFSRHLGVAALPPICTTLLFAISAKRPERHGWLNADRKSVV